MAKQLLGGEEVMMLNNDGVVVVVVNEMVVVHHRLLCTTIPTSGRNGRKIPWWKLTGAPIHYDGREHS